MSSSINALFNAGSLDAALVAATNAVRTVPTDLSARILLAELLIFSQDLQRADVVLDAATTLDPTASHAIADFRQLIRAETARRAFWCDGQMPEFIGAPTPAQQTCLAAVVAWRAGDFDAATRLAHNAETARPNITAQIDGHSYPDFRDVDDLCAGNLEVLTTTGSFYLLPITSIVSITFHHPRRPRDLAWRRAEISVNDGPDGTVYLPALYIGPQVPETDALRLGRETIWIGKSVIRGVGQRLFLAGDEDLAIMDLTNLSFGP